MGRMDYRKAIAKYDAETKTLLIDQPITEFIPSYAYYVCEDLERKQKIDIETVVFLQSKTRAYSKEELKGKYDWSELDGKGRN
jgi:hypothetical protein